MHIKKYCREVSVFFCVLMFLVSVIPSAFAGLSSGNLTNSNIILSVTDENGTNGGGMVTNKRVSSAWTPNGASITGSVTPGDSWTSIIISTATYADKSAKSHLTIQNGFDVDAELIFYYSRTDSTNGTITFSCESGYDDDGGKVSAVLGAGKSLTVTLTTSASTSKNADRTGYTVGVDITGLALAPLDADLNINLQTTTGGSYTVSDGTEIKGPGGSFTNPKDTQYALTAVPDQHYHFDGWFVDGGCVNTSPTVTNFVFGGDATIEARFSKDVIYDIATVVGDESGTLKKEDLVNINSRYLHQTNDKLDPGKQSANNQYCYYTKTVTGVTSDYDTQFVPSLQWTKSGTTAVVGASGVATGEWEDSKRSWAYANMVSDVIQIYAKEDCVIEFSYTGSVLEPYEDTTLGQVTDEVRSDTAIYIYESTAGNASLDAIFAGSTVKRGSSNKIKVSLQQGKYLYVYTNGFNSRGKTGLGGGSTALNYHYNGTISGVTITPNDTKYAQTTTFKDNTGKVLMGGKLTLNAVSYTSDVNGAISIAAMPDGQAMQITSVTAPANYLFLGWEVNGELHASPTYNYTLTANTAVNPVFVPKNVIYDVVNNKYQYKDISGAMTDLNGQYIARNGTYTEFYTSLAEAFEKTDETEEVVLLGNLTINGDFEVPNGEILVVPAFMNDVFNKKDGVYVPTTSPIGSGAYATLTMNGNLTVNGTLIVSGQQTASTGGPGGSYGAMTIASDKVVTVSENKALYGYGLINGEGEIIAKSGTKVHELCEVRDIPHPMLMSDLVMSNSGKQIMPFNSFYINTIEAKTTYEYGASLYGHLALSYDAVTQSSFPAIAPSGSILVVKSGSVTKYYDTVAGKITFRVNEGSVVESGSFTANMSVNLGGEVSAKLESGKFYIPMSVGYQFVIAGDLTMKHDFKMLPGCKVDVLKGGKMTIAQGADVVFYRLNDYDYRRNGGDAETSVGFSAYGYPINISRHSGFSIPSIGSAHLNVDGEVIVNGGLYVTEDPIDDYTWVKPEVAEGETAPPDQSYKNYKQYPEGYNILTGTGRIDMSNAQNNQDIINEHGHKYNLLSTNVVEVTIVPIKGLPKGATPNEDGDYAGTYVGKYVSLVKNETYTSGKFKGVIDENGLNVWIVDPCADGHTEEIDAAVGKTCTTDGKTEGKHCTVCGDILVAQEVIPAGHTPGAAATCTTAQECTVCHAELTAALNHDFSGNWLTDANNHWKKCSRCTEIQGSTAHTWDNACDTDCNSGCGYTRTTSHDFADQPWVQGETQHWHKCKNCDATDTKVAHTYNVTETVEAKCTEDGHKTYSCDCGKSYQETLTAPGHDVKLAENGYTWTAVDGGYSCTANGKCSKCDYTETKSATVTSETTVTATCQVVGKITYTATFASDVTWATTQTKVVETAKNPDNHTYTSVVTPPTCGDQGYTTYTCPCGATYKGNYQDATGNHDLGAYQFEGGQHWKGCTNCDYTTEKENHTDENADGNHACDKCNAPASECVDGDQDHKCDNDTACTATFGEHVQATGKHTCDYCGGTMSQCSDVTGDDDHKCDICDKDNVTEHTYSAATCTAPKTCSECGATTGEALGHTYGEAVVTFAEDKLTYTVKVICTACTAGEGHEKTSEALTSAHVHNDGDCQTNSSDVYTAQGTFEGKSYDQSVTVEGEKGNHAYNSGVVTNPTCTEKGYTTYTCTVSGCTDSYKVDGEAALGHNMTVVKEAAEAATCTENGKTAVMGCSRCDHTEGGATVNATGHTFGDVVEKQAATCTADGHEAYKQCSACNQYFAANADKTSTEGKANITVIDKLGHNMVESAAAVAPKCEVDGKTAVYTCANGCNKTEGGENVDAIGHNWVKGDYTEPTFDADGYYTYTCKNDSTHTKTESVADTKLTAVAMIKDGDRFETLEAAIKAAQSGQTVILLANASGTGAFAPYVLPEGVTLDLNGKTFTGAVVGKVALKGGTLKTYADDGVTVYTMAGPAVENKETPKYVTENAVFVMDEHWNLTVVSGEGSLGEDWRTMPNQTVTFAEGTNVTIGTGKTFTIRGDVIVKGTLTCNGTIVLENKDATLTAAADLNVKLAKGLKDTVLYQNGTYVVHSHEKQYVKIDDAQHRITCGTKGCDWKETAAHVYEGDEHKCVCGDVENFTVTWIVDGNETIVTYDFGAAITAPENPTKTGYTFAGWGKVPATMPAENVTITAKWEINQYTITFETDGGSAIAAITQDYNTAVTAPANPTKTGYTFAGWDKEIPAKMPAENVTITAKWEINQYTVTWKNWNGDVLDTATVEHGSLIPEYQGTPTRPTANCKAYAFAGWEGTVETVTKDLVLTATYTESDAHEFNEETVTDKALKSAATCTEAAVFYYSCKCGAVDKSEGAKTFESGMELGHKYSSTVTKEATCTEDGVNTFTCKNCSDSYTEAIPQTGHNYKDVVTAPTCMDQGYTTHTCSNCDDVKVDTYVNATGHDWNETQYVMEGYEKWSASHTCKNDPDHVEQEEVTLEKVVTDPTCTEDGSYYYKAAFASEWAETKVSKTFTGDTKTGHKYEWTQTQAPTCVAVGSKSGVCSVCNGTAVEEVPVDENAHAWGTEYRYNDTAHWFVCANGCEKVEEVDHECESTYTDPTFDRNGVTTYTCVCGYSYEVEAEGTKLTAVAQIGTQKYQTLNEAIIAANASTAPVTIELLQTVGVAPETFVSAEITFVLTENTALTWVNAYSNLRALKSIAADGFNVETVDATTFKFVRSAVAEPETGEAAIGDTIYATLADAIADAQNGAFINLKADVAEVPANIGKDLVIIPNGFKLAGTEGDAALALLQGKMASGYAVRTNYGLFFINKQTNGSGIVAKIGEVGYYTVKEALEAAKNGDTVVMVADSDESQSDMIVIPGVTLDIKTFRLNARSLVGAEGSYVIGNRYNSSTKVFGKLDAKALILGKVAYVGTDSYGIVPVYDPENLYYVFTKFMLHTDTSEDGLWIYKDDKRIEFKFGQSLTSYIKNEFFKTYDASQHRFQLVLQLQWEGETGTYVQNYTFKDTIVRWVSETDSRHYVFRLSGYDTLELTDDNMDKLVIKAMLVTDSGATVFSRDFKYTDSKN